jgi:hypothetical protein
MCRIFLMRGYELPIGIFLKTKILRKRSAHNIKNERIKKINVLLFKALASLLFLLLLACYAQLGIWDGT